jgi:hypothetical protein
VKTDDADSGKPGSALAVLAQRKSTRGRRESLADAVVLIGAHRRHRGA